MSAASSMDDPIIGFADAIRSAGLEPPEQVTADGKLHRFPTNGRRGDDSGWYVLHDDGLPAGSFGCWRAGITETWCAKAHREFTPEERREFRQRMETQRRARKAEERKRHADAARRAAEVWNSATPGDHPYLQRKGVKDHGARVHEGKLVVPMRDVDGNLHSLQFIAEDCSKKFLTGGKVSGCYCAIGKPDGVLCIAEGFATAATIHEATGYAVACAFNAGNLKPVALALLEKFSEARLIVCADNDTGTEGNPGVTKATEAAEAAGACLAVPDFGEDTGTDFNDLKQLRGPDAVRCEIEKMATATAERVATVARLAAPEPLRRPLPPAKPYPMDALGDILGPAARVIHEVVKAPDAICAQSILAAASLAAQPHADVLMDGRRELLSLWAITIAASGERKSAVDDLALAAHREHERQGLRKYAEEKAAHEIEVMAYESVKRANSKGKDSAKIKHDLGNIGPVPQEPLSPILLATSPTIEGIHRLYKGGQPSLGLFHDDAGEFLGGHAMNQDNRTKSAAGMSKFWDRGEFDRIRGGDGSEKFYGRRFAMHLMMQPVIAETILSDEILNGQGFLPRCLLAWPSSTIGTRRYSEVNASASPELAAYRRRMTELLEKRPKMRDGTQNELEPRALTLAPDAKARWIELYNANEEDQRERGDWSSVSGWASKAGAQIQRVAGVLTLVENPDAEVIRAETIDRAGKIVLFALSEAVRIVGTASVPPEIRHAEALLSWCHAEKRRLLHSRAALQFGPVAIRTKRVFDAAMLELERAGWVTPITNGCEVDGAHRRRVWTITEKPQ